MTKKCVKRGIIGLVLLAVVGGVLFGDDLTSYVKSTIKVTQQKAKDSVPVEFELRRAQDLLEEILPEIHANIRLIAQEEVELANLKQEIAQSQEAIQKQEQKVTTLRNALQTGSGYLSFANRTYCRQEVIDELATQFEHFKEAKLILESREKLYQTREKSLHSAMQLLEKTKAQKRLLAAKIENLESKHRIIKASAVGTGIQVDNSKLAQTERLINQIKKRLDVAERVLAHESQFVSTIPIEAEVNEEAIVAQVDDYFAAKKIDAQLLAAHDETN